MTDLGTLPGDSCSAVMAMNSRGDVVGGSGPCGPIFHAFLRENGGPMLDLNSLIASNPGVTILDALGINGRGEIAVWGLLPNGDVHAMVLIPCHGVGDCQNAVTTRNHLPRSFGPRISVQTRRRQMDIFTAYRARLVQQYHIPGLIQLISDPSVMP